MLATTADTGCLLRVVRTLRPRVVVLSGRREWLQTLSRIAYQARRTSDRVDVLVFRQALEDGEATALRRLGSDAISARDLVVAHLDAAARRSGALPQAS